MKNESYNKYAEFSSAYSKYHDFNLDYDDIEVDNHYGLYLPLRKAKSADYDDYDCENDCGDDYDDDDKIIVKLSRDAAELLYQTITLKAIIADRDGVIDKIAQSLRESQEKLDNAIRENETAKIAYKDQQCTLDKTTEKLQIAQARIAELEAAAAHSPRGGALAFGHTGIRPLE